MTIGNENPVINRQEAKKKKEAILAAAFPQGIRCSKCLVYGHWSYQCKGKRKHLVRPSRTQILKQNMKQKEQGGGCSSGSCKIPKKKKKETKECSDCSSESGQDADKSSSSDSSSSYTSGSESDSDSSYTSSSNSDSSND